MSSKLTIKQIIEKYNNENGFAWGINTVIDSLKPEVEYDLSTENGKFIINKWISRAPSSQEIRDEYIRQETIAEFLDYIKNNKIHFLKILLKK